MAFSGAKHSEGPQLGRPCRWIPWFQVDPGERPHCAIGESKRNDHPRMEMKNIHIYVIYVTNRTNSVSTSDSCHFLEALTCTGQSLQDH